MKYCYIASNLTTSGFGSYISMTESTGVLTMSQNQNYNINVYVICGNHFDEKMFSFSMFVCIGDHTTVTKPGTFQDTQVWEIASGTTPYFVYQDYSVSHSHCTLTYTISSTSLGTTYPSQFDAAYASGGDNRIPLKSAYREIEGTYDIHLAVEARGGAIVYTTSPF